MTTKLLLVGVAVAALVGLLVAQEAAASRGGPKRGPSGLPVEVIKVNGESFDAEVAADARSRTRGLGGRATIGPHEAMIFVHPVSDVLNFWMKDCLTDMDIAFLDRNGKVTAVHTMKKEPPRGADEAMAQYEARLPRYSSELDAIYAFEFAPGTLARLGVKPGQTLPLDHGKLRGYLR